MPWYWILIILSAIFGPFEAMHALNKARQNRLEAAQGERRCPAKKRRGRKNGNTGMNYVYLLRCGDDSLYCGWTTDLEARVEQHSLGRGAKYTRSRLPVKLVWYETYEDRHEALSREWHIKHMNREQKLKLISGAAEGKTVPDRE